MPDSRVGVGSIRGELESSCSASEQESARKTQ